MHEGWVQLLQDRLREKQFPHRVVNASISGDTTSNGLHRLAPALSKFNPEVLILELGGNDGLRGLSLKAMRKNLMAMLEQAKAAQAKVLLLGMDIPPNYGQAYTEKFSAIYRELAVEFSVTLVEHFLANVGDRMDLMQADRIHPTAEAQPTLLDNIYPKLEPLL